MIKNKFLLISTIIAGFAVFTSCVQPNSNTDSTSTTVEVTKTNTLSLYNKREVVYNKTNTAYIDKITNYGDSLLNQQSYETFDYSGFNFETKLGTYTSKVFKIDAESTKTEEAKTTLSEESKTVIVLDNGVYKSSSEYFKYENGVKNEKAYLVNYIEALDANLSLQICNSTYSPLENDKIYSLGVKAFDTANKNNLIAEVTYYTDGAIGAAANITNRDVLKLKSVVIYEYNTDLTLKSDFKFLFEEDASTTKAGDLVASFYNYNKDIYDDNCTMKEMYSAHVSNAYTLFDKNNTAPDLSNLTFDELPTQYECFSYDEYGTDNKMYKVLDVINNDQWDVESKITYSYAPMPGSKTDYYPCISETWTKKGGQGENTTVLEKIMETRKNYTKDKDGVLYLNEIMYVDKNKYSASSENGKDKINMGN